MAHQGRRGPGPNIDYVRELSADEVANMKPAKLPMAKKFRDSHHHVARLVAMGQPTDVVAELTGYSIGSIRNLLSDPAFNDLVIEKRKVVDASAIDALSEYHSMVLTNGLKAERMIADRLDDAEAEPDLVPVGTLVKISRDAADRVGLAKRSVALNVNVDFAAKLDQAIKRSGKTIDNRIPTEGASTLPAPSSPPSPDGGSPSPRLVAHLPAPHLSPQPQVVVGKGGAPVSTRGTQEPLRRRA